MYEYIAPFVSARIGGWLTNKTSKVKVVSSRVNPIDTAQISIPAEGIEMTAIQKGMNVLIEMGYREKGTWPVFTGKVVDVSYGRDVVIYAKDMMEFIKRTKITKSFVDASAQEIVKYALAKAGIEDFTLDDQPLPLKHHFVARGLNVIQLVKYVNQSWGLDWKYYFEPEGMFYWGAWEKSGRFGGGLPVATLEYGQNLLEFVPSDAETGTLQTFLLPFLRHSHVVILRDSRFWDNEVTARIERITYTHGEGETGVAADWRIHKS